MKIFIWKSYGDIKVYDISTPEKYSEVLEDIKKIIQQLGESIPENLKSITDVLDNFGIGTHESFEDGTGIGKLQ